MAVPRAQFDEASRSTLLRSNRRESKVVVVIELSWVTPSA